MKGTAAELNEVFKNSIHKPVPKKRVNWKQELKKERGRTIDEAISLLRKEMRGIPENWKRGYYSAITKLEIMKGDTSSGG